EGRRLVIAPGEKGAVPYFALCMKDAARLAAYRSGLEKAGVSCRMFASNLLGKEAFSVTDPDARQIVFGVAPASAGAARLQHFVCASTRLDEMLAFYRDVLGMEESDRVLEGDALAAVFLRSDP